MQTLKRIFPRLLATRTPPRRRFAQVYDVKIVKVGNLPADEFDRVVGGSDDTSSPEANSGQAAAEVEEFEQLRKEAEMQRNVLHTPLQLHSTSPLTGYLRNGYCAAPGSDAGNHSVAGILSNEFLDFSAARGNDLRAAGLTGGCKWCLCVSRWKEAFDARTSDSDAKVPRVVLGATSERALEQVRLEDLRRFAVDAERGRPMVNGDGGGAGGGGMVNGTGGSGSSSSSSG